MHKTREVQHLFFKQRIICDGDFDNGLQHLHSRQKNGTVTLQPWVANFHRNCQRKCSKQRRLTVLAVLIISDLRPMTYSAPAHPTHWLNAAALEHATNHPAKKKTLADSAVHQTTTPAISDCNCIQRKLLMIDGEPGNYRKLFF